MRCVDESERERALEARENLQKRRLETGVIWPFDRVRRKGPGEQLSNEAAARPRETRQHPGRLFELGDVGQVAVMAEREAGLTERPIDRLRVSRVTFPHRRIA